MRSIRLSLTVYFLALLAAAVGTASVLAYRHIERTLEDKELADREVIQARYDKQCHEKNTAVDNGLLRQALAVAQLVQYTRGDEGARIGKFHRDIQWWSHWSVRYKHQAVQLLATGMTPQPGAPAMIAFWTVEAGQSDFPWLLSGLFYSSIRTQITLRTNDPLPPRDENTAEYFQVNSAWGTEYSSKSLKGMKFRVDQSVFGPHAAEHLLDWENDRVGDVKVRVVRLLASRRQSAPSGVPTGPGPNRGPRGSGRRDDPPAPTTTVSLPSPAPSEEKIRPALYIQYACDTSERDADLALFASERDEAIASLHEETRTSLASFRTHMLLIGGGTFVAVIAGAFWLIRLGVAPLHRLSEAVSRVSEKDFRLHFGGRLPSELEPIAGRLTHTLEELRRAFEREKQATADISHDLRTPLAALLTTIDVTLRKPRQAKEYKEALEDCRASAHQINQIVERLLSLARLDAGVDRIRSQTVDAAQLAQECVGVVRPLAEARGIRVSLDGEPAAQLHTDPDKLREILNNLLHNAIEYNRPNGQIDVAVQRQNGHVCVVVRDTGIGISPSAQQHIFERFYRADPSREADGLHAGLGLAIVKGYVDLMGGRIDVNSVEGEGSTFSVSLPA